MPSRAQGDDGTDASPIRVIAWRRWGLGGASLVAVLARYPWAWRVSCGPAREICQLKLYDAAPREVTSGAKCPRWRIRAGDDERDVAQGVPAW